MYDDASYYTFMPSAQAQEERPQAARHKSKQSLLQQPNESTSANGGLADGTVGTLDARVQLNRPPKATLKRRAQSYSDFHYAVTAILCPEEASKEPPLLGIGEDLRTDLEFSDWYNGLEEDLLDASHDDYRVYQEQLEFSQSYLESVAKDTSSTLDLLASLSESFRAVEAQTTAFQKHCESLLSEQNRLTGLVDNLGRNLQYYNYLEPITRRLNAPGAGNFVRAKEFSEMLSRLDECLEYMAAHSWQREAATYQSRYRLLMTRGLTLVRMHFVGASRDIAQDVTKRIADRQLNDTTMSALLYAKFRVGASELKELAQEIRKRAVLPVGVAPGAEGEYQGLMSELYTSYAATRGRLVIPLARKKIGDIAIAPSTSKDLVAFARTSIGYIKGICSDEYELWREWFEGDDGIFDFLESVCEPLYDHLRPRIIHENQLLKLCELCTLLQTRYMRDQEEDGEPTDSNQLDFSPLILPALEDAQTRLVFRTQAILRDDIENYKSKAEDLDYPSHSRKISSTGTKSNAPATSGRKTSLGESVTVVPKDSVLVDGSDFSAGRWGFDTEAAFQRWYPTLKKAIWLLSRIYRLVNSTVFDDLAHQIVHQTTLSLHRASSLLGQKATPTDAHLFLLKHLLTLKQQIVAFDIEYVTPDISVDFSGVTNTFWELRERGGLFDPRNLWRFMGGGLLPRVVENMLDAKAELDGRLRTVINDFTHQIANRITTSISEIAVAAASKDRNSSAATGAVRSVQEVAEREVPMLRAKLDEYLDDARTKETLVGAVRDQVVMNYEAFYERWGAIERDKSRKGKGKGKGKEKEKEKEKAREEGEGDGEVWDTDTFAEWAGGVFAVSRGRLKVGQEEGGSMDLSESRSRNGSVSGIGSRSDSRDGSI